MLMESCSRDIRRGLVLQQPFFACKDPDIQPSPLQPRDGLPGCCFGDGVLRHHTPRRVLYQSTVEARAGRIDRSPGGRARYSTHPAGELHVQQMDSQE
jgi:hypothetical protein